MTRLHYVCLGLVGGVIAGGLGLWFLLLLIPLAGWRSKRRWIICLCIGIIIGSMRLWQWQTALESQPIPDQLNQARTVVVAPIDLRDGYAYLTLRLQPPLRGQIRVTVTPFEHYLPGDIILLSGSTETPKIISDGSTSFDYPRYLARFGITKLVRWPKIETTGLIQQRWLLLRWLTLLRNRLEQQINLLLPEPEAGFLAGLLIGARRSLSETVLNNLTVTGTIHIIAVSGANVVIVADVVLKTLRWLTLNRWWSFWLTWSAIIGFVIITGLSAAAIRGGLVASLVLIASHTARGQQQLPLIIIPAALTLLANPYFKYDIGWQFSFAAFAGILLATPVFQAAAARWPRCPPLFVEPLVETTSASVFLTPVLIWQLNAFSFSSFLINPLVLWLVPLATVVGAAGVVLAWLIPIDWIRLPVWLPLHLILQIIGWGAKLPWYVDWS